MAVVKKPKGKESAPESGGWEHARKYTNLYGNIPSSFSSLIRLLIADQQKGGALSFSSKWQMNRLLRSNSMKAPFYFTTRTFKKGLFTGGRKASLAEMVAAWSPLDLASLLTVLYLYRRARHLCEESEWKFISAPLQTRCEVGGLIGQGMENVGFNLGLLAGSMRALAMVVFHLHDQAGFTEYRRQVKLAKKNYNLEMEQKRWGCTHIQVASNLLVGLGTGTAVADVVCKGFEMEELNNQLARTRPYAVRVTEVWIDALMASGIPPNIVHSGLYYPLEEDLKQLLYEAGLSTKAGSQFFWLEKGKDSINPQDTPELMAPTAAEPEEARPAEVAEEISGDIIEE